MSLDIWFTSPDDTELAWFNITHNLTGMAREAGIYETLWRADTTRPASSLIKPLTEGLINLRNGRVKFEKFNSPNGWGMYEHFVPFVDKVLNAAKTFPDAKINVSI